MHDHPIAMLTAEHRIILKVVDAMVRTADVLDHGGKIDPDTVLGMVRFMREFADARHHGKEEARLFPALLAAGFPAQGGPVQVMVAEHVRGREGVGAIHEAALAYSDGVDGAASDLAEALRAIAALYTQHIRKEDSILFPMAERALDESATAELAAEFAAVEAEHGEASRAEFVRFAEGL